MSNNGSVDAIVLCCSDHRLEQAHRGKLLAQGLSVCHVIQVPGGPLALSKSLASYHAHQTDAVMDWLRKALELTSARTVVCISHDDCGAYRMGKIDFLSSHARRSHVTDPQGHLARDMKDAFGIIRSNLHVTDIRLMHARGHQNGATELIFVPEHVVVT